MTTKNARRRCAALLRDLDLTEYSDVDSFIEQFGRLRGRRLYVLPGMIDGRCGTFVEGVGDGSADAIFVDPDATPFYRAHIMLHETGHILLKHPSSPRLKEVVRNRGFEHVVTMYTRGEYTDEQEDEAEIMAELISERIEQTALQAGTSAVAWRLAQAMGEW